MARFMFYSCKLVSLVLILNFLSACSFFGREQIRTAVTPPAKEEIKVEKGLGNGTIDFAMVYEKVLKPSCVECHSSAPRNRTKVYLESYQDTVKDLVDVRDSILDGSMPKDRPALSAEQKKLILDWINSGAPEKVNSKPVVLPQTPAPGDIKGIDVPSSTALNYSQVKKYVLDPACLKCHSNPENKGRVNLESYEQVLKNLRETEASILDGSMPKKSKLSESQKKLILSWIETEAPQFQGSKPTRKPIPSVPPREPQTEAEILSVRRGEYLFHLSACTDCHTADPRAPLAGRKALTTPFGVFYGPNISSDPTTGIGLWSKKDFINALRHGKSPKGTPYYPAFPYTNYSKMSDRDMLSIQAYIMSLAGYNLPNLKHKVGFPLNQKNLLFFWMTLYFPKINEINESNFKLSRGPFTGIKNQGLDWNRGAYLVEGVLHCTACHTPRDPLGGLIQSKWMAGAPGVNGNAYAPNITSDQVLGLGLWSPHDWKVFLSNGHKPNGDRVSGEMLRLIRNGYSKLSEDDMRAVIKYLQDLEPKAH